MSLETWEYTAKLKTAQCVDRPCRKAWMPLIEENRAQQAENKREKRNAQNQMDRPPSIFICNMWGRGSHDHVQNKRLAERKRVHDSSNAPPDVNNFRSETFFVHDQTKHVSAQCEHSGRQMSLVSPAPYTAGNF